jgi:hypothetical protein
MTKKPPGFAGRFLRLKILAYSPLPKRRDHHPARRGWVSVVVSADAGSADADSAEAGSGGVWLTMGADGSGWALTRKLTFSRTVERRRAAARSAS